MGTIFEIENISGQDLQLDYIMVYNGTSWLTAVQRPSTDLKNGINSGFHLISLGGFELKNNTIVDCDTLFNTWVLYKNGLASDQAFVLFGVRGSNLHIGLRGEYLINTGVYGDNPGAVTWSYSPKNPNERQRLSITGAN